MQKHVQKIIAALGLKNEIIPSSGISGVVKTDTYTLNGVEVSVCFTKFGNSDNIRVEVELHLPEDGVLADTYIKYVGNKQKLPTNHEGRFYAGPKYPDWANSLLKKKTDVYSPWNNHYMVIESMYYNTAETDDAVDNVIRLAKPFIQNLSALSTLRYWKTDDKEVIEKANEIILNADFYESDIDRETKSHYMRDRNSFIKGWFNPFNNNGRGTFDTLWPSSLDYAAKAMGNEGSFEYAVACIVLENKDLIAKARKACVIRKEIQKVLY